MAWLVLLATFAGVRGVGLAGTAGLALIATVFAAVYHAEVVAHRIGEPFGTIVLAIAVTIIEVALIISVVIAAPAEKADLARDTVFSAVMIVCNGVGEHGAAKLLRSARTLSGRAGVLFLAHSGR